MCANFLPLTKLVTGFDPTASNVQMPLLIQTLLHVARSMSQPRFEEAIARYKVRNPHILSTFVAAIHGVTITFVAMAKQMTFSVMESVSATHFGACQNACRQLMANIEGFINGGNTSLDLWHPAEHLSVSNPIAAPRAPAEQRRGRQQVQALPPARPRFPPRAAAPPQQIPVISLSTA